MLRTKVFFGLAPLGLLATVLTSGVAWAQPPGSDGGSEPGASRGAGAERPNAGDGRPGGKRIVLDDEFLVEGQLEKPSAFYVFRRSAADYDWARLDARFSPLVLESVQDPLF